MDTGDKTLTCGHEKLMEMRLPRQGDFCQIAHLLTRKLRLLSQICS